MTDLLELKRLARARAAAGWKTMDGMLISDLLALIADIERLDEDASMRAIRSLRGDCKNLLVERNYLAFLLKRFVDGEHDQDENQAERHMYHDEAQTLLSYLGGDVQGHTLVPDASLHAMSADAELFRWLAIQCGEEFEVDVKGVKADGGEVGWALGYEGETCLRQAVQAAMIEDGEVATQNTHNENVSRHERR